MFFGSSFIRLLDRFLKSRKEESKAVKTEQTEETLFFGTISYWLQLGGQEEPFNCILRQQMVYEECPLSVMYSVYVFWIFDTSSEHFFLR